MKKINKIISVILVLALFLTFCGCSDNGESSIIYYGVTEVPNSIDPQTAESGIELLLVRNLYEGLLRQDNTGNIVNGVIDSYTKDGLSYTFKISDSAVWSDGSPLTAEDFCFAFKRAVNPITKSPNVACLFSIKNASKIASGQKGEDLLGVKALDEKTLKIELEKADDSFLYTLTTSICMPCKEEFFETCRGKYGMSYDTTLSNGSYKLRKWAVENFAMRILKNDHYEGNFIPKNAAVYFTKNNDLSPLECLDKSYVDMAEIFYEDLNNAKPYTIEKIDSTVWIMRYGKNYSATMKKALIYSALAENDYEQIGYDIKVATTVYPEIFSLNTEKQNVNNPIYAAQLYGQELENLPDKVFPQTAIRFYGGDTAQNIAKKIAGNWQTALGAYVNISEADYLPKDLSATMDYDLLLYPIDITEKNIYKYFNLIGSNYDTSIDLNSFQQNLYNGHGNFLPVAFSSRYFAYADCLTNVYFYKTNGYIDFSQVIKNN